MSSSVGPRAVGDVADERTSHLTPVRRLLVIAFSVDRVGEVQGVFFVDGRCLQGPIHTGDTFTLIYKFADVNARTSKNDLAAVRLRVERLSAYRHSLDEIHTGLTARIELTGDPADLNHVKPGSVLEA